MATLRPCISAHAPYRQVRSTAARFDACRTRLGSITADHCIYASATIRRPVPAATSGLKPRSRLSRSSDFRLRVSARASEQADAVKGSIVTVFGATGRVGRAAVERLLQRGATVRGVVRNAEKAEVLPTDNEQLDVCVCDLTNASAIGTVLEGADAAIWCASLEESSPSPIELLKGLLPFGKSAKSMGPVDIIAKQLQQLNQGTCLALLSSAAVTRTAWSKEKKQRLGLVVDIPIVRLNPFGTLDKQREQEQRLRGSGVPYAVVRPVGLKSSSDWAPGRPLLSQGDVAVGRANMQDVADVLIAAAFSKEAWGKTFEMITVQGYAPPADGFKGVFSRLLSDDERSAAGEDIGFGAAEPRSPGEQWVSAQYNIMMQLLPGEAQDPTRLEMGRKYEEVDSGTVDRKSGAAPTQREKNLAAGIRNN
eukprot:CAMPEP_0117657294 /NCGR_PEP_ID=MMETSP0804-20121206/5254_1 /TAXON_ID=1074897 /ORGANISM="Tetraselmis astigmatica, Strain CCMP880" /LENGTH=421 /DNA_ID=CAMNT_0005463739 /DNA_START=162 /DNA_END=1427 /DNA_ORIENTATION=+